MTRTLTSEGTFDRLLEIMSGELFLKKRGLANELPYFILPYDPKLEIEATGVRKLLLRRLAERSVSVLDVNLYDVCKSILEERGLWDRLLERETEIDKGAFLETLQSVLDPQKYLVPAIVSLVNKARPSLLILSGVGEVFPYVRSHALLTNLQSAAGDQLTVMFFPGDYTFSPASGATLNIFGLKQDDRFYRAINILDYEV